MDWKLFQKKLSRRDFCKLCAASGLTALASPLLLNLFRSTAFGEGLRGGVGFINKKEALFYETINDKTLQCHLCSRGCMLSEGMKGFCRARKASGGKLWSLVYGNPTAIHVDPIEKKPLFHFLPASMAFSIATAGCNYRCKCCQNWQISQSGPEETANDYLSPDDVVAQARARGCATIAYTYTEPSIFYEYMLDTAKIGKTKGVRSMYHSNGSLTAGPVEMIAPFLDAANIDLKGFRQEFYSEIPEGYLETVLDALKLLKKKNVWIEITNLILPGMNDNPAVIKEMVVWIKENLGPDTPLHFSRFFPTYKLQTLPPTPVSTLEEAHDIATAAGMRYVYIGNVPGHSAESTICPRCKSIAIRRSGYSVLEINIDKQGTCKKCGEHIAGVWS